MTSPGLLIFNCRIFYSGCALILLFSFLFKDVRHRAVRSVNRAHSLGEWLLQRAAESGQGGWCGAPALPQPRGSSAGLWQKMEQNDSKFLAHLPPPASILALAQTFVISIRYKYTRANFVYLSLKASCTCVAAPLYMRWVHVWGALLHIPQSNHLSRTRLSIPSHAEKLPAGGTWFHLCVFVKLWHEVNSRSIYQMSLCGVGCFGEQKSPSVYGQPEEWVIHLCTLLSFKDTVPVEVGVFLSQYHWQDIRGTGKRWCIDLTL